MTIDNMMIEAHGSSRDVQIVCFRLATEDYGLDIMHIKEIIRCQKTKSIPKAPPFIDGVINLRGMVIPVIDLRKRFDLPDEISPKARIIIAQIEDRIVGLIVDAVTDILAFPRENLLAPPVMTRKKESEYLDGIVNIEGRLLLILNLDKILTFEEKKSLDAPLQ